ncbi:septal ring lytic transglycosylase RlpA family protein [Bordetella sp. 02P26C-1]|uniref:septal ring lytic transglycosylase RlpA family protein n=1 Tax=Bordetella sp. 02P26C-1 TaxID=2683195 RepID=UPI0013546843|nr:septal ring lytic transglycosylase RlpA family protein [Bordetella sp. 02P26C-1]
MNVTRSWLALVIIGLAVAIAGCSSPGKRKAGGYYQDDGPGHDIPANIDKIPDAVPRIEPLASGANRPYTVLGKNYVPIADPDRPYKVRGIASWYGRKFHGNSTSIGEAYDMYAMTAAHPTMPLPSYARVTSHVNGKTVIVRVNDRGPFLHDRVMDLSYAAAHKLGIVAKGSGEVTVERILPAEIRLAQSRGGVVTASGASNAVATASEDLPIGAAPIATASLTMTELAPMTPAASAQQMTASPSSSAGAFYLQMGAFSQPGNAQALVQQVNQQLADAQMVAAVHQNGMLYRVRMGPYSDRASALSAAQRVADRIGIMPSLATP